MVFSQEPQAQAISPYGSTLLSISSTPLITGTTVKDHIVFNIDVQLFNLSKDVVGIILANVESEILAKVNSILSPFNGNVNDENPSNIPVSTIGGAMNYSIVAQRLVAGTSNPDEIVFNIEIDINACNRTRLIDLLRDLDQEIMGRVNDIL